MDDTDAIELIGIEDFVRALLAGGPFVVPTASAPSQTNAALRATSERARRGGDNR